MPPYEPKKMDFGKIPVCSKCGSAIFRSSENPDPICCGESITLKRYMEEVKGKKINNDEWGFEDKHENLICLEDKEIVL